MNTTQTASRFSSIYNLKGEMNLIRKADYRHFLAVNVGGVYSVTEYVRTQRQISQYNWTTDTEMVETGIVGTWAEVKDAILSY